MKRISVLLVMLLCIVTFSLTYNCNKGTSNNEKTVDNVCDKIFYELKDTVWIYLTYVKYFVKDKNCDTTYHLGMFDANGDRAIDNLTTYILPRTKYIIWNRVENSGIQQIDTIVPKPGADYLFQKGVKKDSITGNWILQLPEDMENQYNMDKGFRKKEEYTIIYTPENYIGKEPKRIDPPIEVPPPEGQW